MIYTLFIVIGGFIMLYSAFYLGSDWNELSKKERTNYLLKLGFGTILCLGSFIYNESLYQYKCEEKDGDIKKAYVCYTDDKSRKVCEMYDGKQVVEDYWKIEK